ncbi:WbuC family cupin fold metalloprotein, partial [Klebsiella pneumoniae]
MSNQESPGGVSRRALLKSTALGSLALAAGGLTLPFTLRRAAAAVQQATGDTTRIVWGACSVNCGSRCALRLHVRDDEVVYVETDNTGDDRYGDHQVRACLRGRSIRRRINHPDRLNYPMKRVGKRGEGKFVRISWQEALDTLADRLKSVVAQYGNEAVYINPGTYVRPHRHPHTFELLLPLRGRFVVLNFDDRGTVTHRAILG